MKRWILVLLCVLLAIPAWAVDPLEVESPTGTYRRIVYDWESASDGTATGQTTLTCPGVLLSAYTIPGTGDDAPSPNYDIVVNQMVEAADGTWSALSTDAANSELLNRHTSNTEHVDLTSASIKPVTGRLQIAITNAGDANTGRLVLTVYAQQFAKRIAPGTGFIPAAGASTQLLQYTSAGAVKWITASGDATIADGGAVAVGDDSHAHTTTTISGLDISADTNLTAGSGVVLTDDALSHSTANGYKHIPSTGASTQLLQYSSEGTAKWSTVSGDATIADGGAVTVGDDSHAHTTTTVSGLDISADTNLAVTSPIVLTDDTLSHATTAGNIHLPAAGASANIIQYSAAGTGKWVALSGDATVADGGAVAVADDSHAHTTTTISGLDISADTNLTAGSGVVLTDDALSHSTANGFKHIPATGASTQLLQYSSEGTAKWVSVSGDATIADNGAVTIAANSVALTTDTTGNYVASVAGTSGRTSVSGTAGEGWTATVDLASGVATAGTYQSVTVDTYGRVTAGTVHRQPIELTSAGIKATTTGGCTPPALDANDNWGAAFTTGKYGFWQFSLPNDFDGSVDRLVIFWSGPAAAATWSFATVVMEDATALNTAYTTFGGPTTIGGTPEVDKMEVAVDTTNFSGLFGTSANANKLVKLRVKLESGDNCKLHHITLEY